MTFDEASLPRPGKPRRGRYVIALTVVVAAAWLIGVVLWGLIWGVLPAVVLFVGVFIYAVVVQAQNRRDLRRSAAAP
jgi:fatty acid desaturase